MLPFLLDCTLRDGGYINNWNFGYKTIQSIISNLAKTGVHYIEVGFLKNCKYNKDYTLFNKVSDIENISQNYVDADEAYGNSKFLAMIINGDYGIDKLESNSGIIDGIRLVFHNYDMDDGINACKKIMDKGYKCFCNPNNIMGYSDDALLQLLEKVNKIHPYCFSIVDTFGSMRYNDLIRIYSLCENNLEKDIAIGLHLHENLAQSFSLAQSFIYLLLPMRTSVLDASIYGMGRAPGNLCIEVIMDYCNRYFNCDYKIDYALESIENHIAQFQFIERWGYSPIYFLSAKHNLHRDYSQYFADKGKLTMKSIEHILKLIPKEKKAVFDREYAENAYLEYQNKFYNDCNDLSLLSDKLKDKPILILASGTSIVENEREISEFIIANDPVIISANFLPDKFTVNLSFFTNTKRYNEYKQFIKNTLIISTSNIEQKTNIKLNYYDLLSKDDAGFIDNNVLMLLKLFIKLNINSVFIAGFDGFRVNAKNYHDPFLAFSREPNKEFVRIRDVLDDLRNKIIIKFLTPSLYEVSAK